MADSPRIPRAPWKVLTCWIVGCITDPHSRTTSAAKIAGLVATTGLVAYVLVCAWTRQEPSAMLAGEFVSLIIAALALRPRTTVEGKLPVQRRAADVQAPAAVPPKECG